MKKNVQLEKLNLRTKRFAVEIVRLQGTLPKTIESQVIAKHIVRAGTLVGARYREVLQVDSAVEFINKLHSCRQALEETVYWLELLEESGISNDYVLQALGEEAAKLSGIFAGLIKRTKPRRNLREVAKTLDE